MFIKLKNLTNPRSTECHVSLENAIEQKRTYSKIINRIIQNIYQNEPAGLLHARLLSRIVKRPIRIWHDERAVYNYGKSNGKPAIEAEYCRKNPNAPGHWSLRGGRDAAATSENGCLYEVIASQTGAKSSELKRKTTLAVRRRFRFVVNALLAAEEPLLGGARYAGRGPSDAQQVLDASQYGQCHPEGRSGHPRGHASHPQSSSNRSDDTVEAYSYSRWRSGFLSRADQDLVCHHALVTSSARDLMERLNGGQFKVDSHISRTELDYDPLPQAQVWQSGAKQGSPGHFRTVCLVGKHFLSRHNDPYADIFVLTFYPIL